MSFAHPDIRLADMARPFAWIAAVAFLTGFLLGLAVYLGQVAGARAGPTLRPALIHTAPQGPGWNAVKSI